MSQTIEQLLADNLKLREKLTQYENHFSRVSEESSDLRKKLEQYTGLTRHCHRCNGTEAYFMPKGPHIAVMCKSCNRHSYFAAKHHPAARSPMGDEIDLIHALWDECENRGTSVSDFIASVRQQFSLTGKLTDKQWSALERTYPREGRKL